MSRLFVDHVFGSVQEPYNGDRKEVVKPAHAGSRRVNWRGTD